jgi:hypothetical protein
MPQETTPERSVRGGDPVEPHAAHLPGSHRAGPHHPRHRVAELLIRRPVIRQVLVRSRAHEANALGVRLGEAHQFEAGRNHVK